MLLNAWESMHEKIPELRLALEADFRAILGVEIADAAARPAGKS